MLFSFHENPVSWRWVLGSEAALGMLVFPGCTPGRMHLVPAQPWLLLLRACWENQVLALSRAKYPLGCCCVEFVLLWLWISDCSGSWRWSQCCSFCPVRGSRVPCPCQGGGTRWALRSLPTPTIPWLYIPALAQRCSGIPGMSPTPALLSQRQGTAQAHRNPCAGCPPPSSQTNNSSVGSKLRIQSQLTQVIAPFTAPCCCSQHSTANFGKINLIVTAW